MAFRFNYSQQRNDRQRAKDQKKQEKLRRREAEADARRQAREGVEPAGGEKSTADPQDG